MTLYTLKDLNIKLLDFVVLLSPLGTVKKIVSNGDKYLFEIYFNNKINIRYEKITETNNYINNSIFKLYYDNKLGYIINDKLCILEISKGIYIDDTYLRNLQVKDKKNISKYLRKNIPKDCQIILKNNLFIDKKKTDPDKVNITNFNGYHKILV